IVIDVEKLREVQKGALGRLPTESEEKGLIRNEIDTELLYRDALARGLDEGDRAIRAWLVRKMRFVSDDAQRTDDELYAEALALGLDQGDQVVRRSLVEKMRLLAGLLTPPAEPTDEELQAYLLAHEDVFRDPARLSLEHVFLSRDRRGDALDENAAALLVELQAGGGEDWQPRGDPFPLGRTFQLRSERQLESFFGTDFARDVFTLPEGAWSGPVASAYGTHLVRVGEKRASHIPPLDSLRNQLYHRVLEERRAASLSVLVEELRGRYEIFVEYPDERGRVEADIALAG
ncbi:MAG: peptidylprolyl isomerase, partial [bacterium]